LVTAFHDSPSPHPDPNSIRLIATDLDGTLFAPDHEVSDETARALRRAADRGVEVVVATGRSHWSAVPRLEHLECIRWIICSNGATVYDMAAGEIVLRRELTDEQSVAVTGSVAEQFPGVGFAWESPDGVFHTDRWIANRRAAGGKFGVTERPTKELDLIAESILKLMVAHHELTEYAWLDAVAPHVPAELSVSTSGAAFVEVTAPEANKGDAIRLLCADLGVDRTETIAFGDHSNDLGMLTWAGTGYAMGDAGPRIREAADATAPSNADHGVAQVLDVLFGG
jgi:Cof subfamily protein (haloacid dehalogenase superfamily)